MLTIKFEASDGLSLKDHLVAQGLAATIIESKGISDVSTILVALGGGAGIALIIEQVGTALNSYFLGRAKLETARRVTFTVGKVKIDVSADNVDAAVEALRISLTSTR